MTARILLTILILSNSGPIFADAGDDRNPLTGLRDRDDLVIEPCRLDSGDCDKNFISHSGFKLRVYLEKTHRDSSYAREALLSEIPVVDPEAQTTVKFDSVQYVIPGKEINRIAKSMPSPLVHTDKSENDPADEGIQLRFEFYHRQLSFSYTTMDSERISKKFSLMKDPTDLTDKIETPRIPYAFTGNADAAAQSDFVIKVTKQSDYIESKNPAVFQTRFYIAPRELREARALRLKADALEAEVKQKLKPESVENPNVHISDLVEAWRRAEEFEDNVQVRSSLDGKRRLFTFREKHGLAHTLELTYDEPHKIWRIDGTILNQKVGEKIRWEETDIENTENLADGSSFKFRVGWAGPSDFMSPEDIDNNSRLTSLSLEEAIRSLMPQGEPDSQLQKISQIEILKRTRDIFKFYIGLLTPELDRIDTAEFIRRLEELNGRPHRARDENGSNEPEAKPNHSMNNDGQKLCFFGKAC